MNEWSWLGMGLLLVWISSGISRVNAHLDKQTQLLQRILEALDGRARA